VQAPISVGEALILFLLVAACAGLVGAVVGHLITSTRRPS
jgi:hypothetical protein